MDLLVSLIVLLSGLLALTSVRGESLHSDVDILARLEALTARVDVLESRDLQHRQHAATMQTKLARQGRELLFLRRLLERPNKTPPKEQMDVQDDVSEVSDVITAQMPSEGANVKHDQNQAKVPRIRRQEAGINVAFLATLVTSAKHLGQNQNVAFDNVVTNEGNAYNPHAGLFFAPVDGTYVFSMTVTARGRDTSHFGFALNGHAITKLQLNGNENWGDSTAQTVVLKLHAGDDVSVQQLDTDHELYGDNHSMFSGFLLPQTSGSTSTVVG